MCAYDPAPKRDVKKYIRIRGASENNLKHVDGEMNWWF